ncbi:MAG: hypothetical protein ACPGVU_22370 [Limisphaerales bacterium]
MESFFDKLGLRPAERRLVVGSGVVLFIVINIYVIWPHFGDWKKLRKEITDAEATIVLYKEEGAKIVFYESKQAELEVSGVKIPSSEMHRTLFQSILTKTDRAKVRRRSTGKVVPTNSDDEFFQEYQINVSFHQTKAEALLQFLISLGAGESVIRVKSITVSPDSTGMTLAGSMTLVASYQKEK